jgi:hypothetical protein
MLSAIRSTKAKPAAVQPPGVGAISSERQPMTFQERIAMERQRHDREQSLP